MKNTTFILLISLLAILQKSQAQCPAGDLILQNQAQINYFVEQCPDVDTIQGALIIGDLNSNITDITGLISIKVVTGGLTVQHNDSLRSLNGLDSLGFIGEWLNISKNKLLESLDHLEEITTLNSSIFISDNDELSHLTGLQNINSFDGDLTITKNDNLLNINGLSNIQEAFGNVRIHDNMSLSTIGGLNLLKSIQGDLTIQSNEALKNVDGLDSLESIGNHCSISYNPSLSDLNAFAKLSSIGGDLFIGSNSSLSNCTGICGLINNNEIAGSIAIGDNLSNCLNNSVLIPYCQTVPTLSVANPEIKVFPNPTHQYLTPREHLPEKIQKVSISSLSGKIIRSQENKNNLLDISDLSSGMYILAVHTKNQVYFQKFVVN